MSRPTGPRRAWCRALVVAALALGASACERRVLRAPAEPPPHPPYEERLAAPSRESASAVSEEELPPAIALVERPRPPELAAAAVRDLPPTVTAPIEARRFVYRVRLAVPQGVGQIAESAPIPAAELIVDVSHDRLRARFEGAGWPIEPGSEVRLRRDSPGVYVIDSHGGQPLEGGRLADWFEGGTRRPGPPLSIRRDAAARGDIPGALVCALLAEWAGEPRDDVMPRCELGAPSGFRMALWRAERTADVPLSLTHADLRADEVGAVVPPRDVQRRFLEPEAVTTLHGHVGPDDEVTPSDEPPPDAGLLVENRSDTRLIVTVEGVPLGWLSPGDQGAFPSLPAGRYHIGALRPLGNIALRARRVEVPGHIVIPTPRRRRPRPPPPSP